jgi:ADP-ribose pyrophosphatase
LRFSSLFSSQFAYIIGMPKTSRVKNKARVISSKVAYRGSAFWVTTDQVLEPSGVRTRRDIVRHSGSVVVLAVQESKSGPLVLLEHQYRHAAQQYLWELPAGRIDEGEKPLAAAKRELLEETGYTAKQWKRILYFFASPGFVAEPMSLFLAEGLTEGEAEPEDDEVIHKEMVPLTTAVSMVVKGKISDAKTISGVLWLTQQRNRSKPHK